MPRDDTKDEHVHVVVTQGQKARWSTHVEESHEYDSMSDFIRRAAEKQYARDIQGGEIPNAIDSMHDDIMEELEGVESMLRLTREQMEQVQTRQIDDETVDRIVGGYVEALEDKLEQLVDQELKGGDHDE